MMDKKTKFIDIEANTVEEAIDAGVKKLNLPKEKIKIKILSEPQRGLFGMNGPFKAKVRIYY